jgi:excisionase family DNA binding protein
MTEVFLSLQDVADELGISVQTIRKWVKAGELAAYKPGKEYRIKSGDLEEFLKTREVGPKAQSPLPLDKPERAPGIEVVNSYFVPLEEGEEEDTVEIRFYYARLVEGDEPILQAMREASPEEAAKMRQQRERAGGTRE